MAFSFSDRVCSKDPISVSLFLRLVSSGFWLHAGRERYVQSRSWLWRRITGVGDSRQTLKSYMKEGTKISKDGSIAAAELLRMFVVGWGFPFKSLVEAIHRAHLEADNKEVVTAQDIQRILPQLLLDF